MTDNTQAELDEVLDEFLTDIYMNNEHFAANQEALDKTKEEPMQAILDWHNKQTLELLDRFQKDCELNYTTWGNSERMLQVSGVIKRIEAERNKLKEGSNGN